MEDTFDLPKATLFHVGILGLGGVWVFCLKEKTDLAFSFMPLDAVVLARLALAILCTIFSIHRYTSLNGNYKFYQDGLWPFSEYVLIYFLVSRALDAAEARRVLGAGLLAGLLASLYAIVQALGWDPFFSSSSAWIASTLGNPNFLGAFLCLILPLGMGRFVLCESRLQKWLWMIWLSVVFVALLLTRTRSAWLGFLVGSALFALLAWGRLRSQWRYVALFIVVVSFSVGASFIVSKNLWIGVAERASVFLDWNEPSARARLFHWTTALEAAAEHPWLGSGLDTFAYSFPPHQDIASVRFGGRLMIASNAHNEILQTLATMGWAGLIVYIWFLVRWGLTARSAFIGSDADGRICVASLISGALALWVHAQFNFNVLTTWFYFWVISGVLSREADKHQVKKKRYILRFSSLTKNVVIGTYGLGATALIWASLVHYEADRVFSQGIRLQNAARISAAMEKYEDAIRMNPGLTPAYFYLGTAAKRLADASMSQGDVVRRCLDMAVASFQNEVKFFPLSPTAHNNLAMAYMWRMAALKEPLLPAAFKEINEAIRLGPALPDVWDHLAQMEDFVGNKTEAIRSWGRAVEAMPSYYPAWKWLHERLPPPPFDLISQSIEADDVPLGVLVDLKRDKGVALQIMNEQEKDLELTMDVLETQDAPLVVSREYSRLINPERFLQYPRKIKAKALTVTPIHILVKFPSHWFYSKRKFFCPIYIGVSGEHSINGRFAQLLIKTD